MKAQLVPCATAMCKALLAQLTCRLTQRALHSEVVIATDVVVQLTRAREQKQPCSAYLCGLFIAQAVLQYAACLAAAGASTALQNIRTKVEGVQAAAGTAAAGAGTADWQI